MARKLFAKHLVRKIFLEDWGLKLTALVITLGLWFGVTGLSKPAKEQISRIPLYPTISTEAVITNAIKPDIDIFVSGDKRNLERIVKSDLSAGLDLTDVAPGDWVITLSPENVSVNLPQGVTLDKIQPGNLAVKLEAVAEKDIEVKVETTGVPAVGYEIYSVSSLPPKIRVRGPASVMQTLEYVQTDKIDLTGKKEEFTARQMPVSVSSPNAAVLNTVVDVYFRIGEKRVERAFSAPVTGETGKTATFILYGPRTLLQKARADQFKAEMYLNDNGEEAPRVVLPAELQDIVEIRNLKIK